MLAFVHIHKTGGTTVGWMLRSAFGARHCELLPVETTPSPWPWETPATAVDFRFAMRAYPRLRSIGGHYVQPHSDLHEARSDLSFFTMVRDPLEMRASMYQHGLAALGPANITLEDWLEEPQSQNRLTKMIAGSADAAAAVRVIEDRNVFIGLTDHFDESLVMLRTLRTPDLDIRYRRMRVALGSSAVRDLLADQRTRSMLMDGLDEDTDFHEWIRQEWYPRQRREYGPTLDEDTARFLRTMEQYRGSPVSQHAFQSSALAKLSILRDIEPFNRSNVVKFLAAKSGIYQPAVAAGRRLAANRRRRDGRGG